MFWNRRLDSASGNGQPGPLPPPGWQHLRCQIQRKSSPCKCLVTKLDPNCRNDLKVQNPPFVSADFQILPGRSSIKISYTRSNSGLERPKITACENCIRDLGRKVMSQTFLHKIKLWIRTLPNFTTCKSWVSDFARKVISHNFPQTLNYDVENDLKSLDVKLSSRSGVEGHLSVS